MGAEFVTVGKTNEIPAGNLVAFDVRGTPVAVANVGGTYYAFDDTKQGTAAARNMCGRRLAYDEVHWFWSDQYDANFQYAGYHTSVEQMVVRGQLDSSSFLACYVNQGRIDAAVGLNRARDVRRVMPLIKSRQGVSLEALQDESVDLRSLHEGT